MKDKTTVLFFLASLGGGGAERVTVNMIRLLDKRHFDVHLVLVNSQGPLDEYLPEDISLHDFQVSKTMFSILKLRKSIITIRPDIIYSTLFRTNQALFFALQTIRIKPFVMMRSPDSPKLILENKELGPISKRLLEWSYMKADVIIAQTPEMKAEIVRYHNIDESKIRVFLNPLDTDSIDKKIENIDNPFEIDHKNIVAAGRLTRQKGFDVLIEAFRYVVDTDKDFILHIVGDDLGDKDKLVSMVQDLSLDHNVRFLGYQDNPYRFFFFSDLFVLSSRWEGMPNTVIENLYLQKPIVATRCIPFMDRLISNGKNGFLVDVENSQQLAKAILDYENIQMDLVEPIVYQGDVNELFGEAHLLKS